MLIVIMPISVHYIMKGGIISDWVVNVQDVAKGLSIGSFVLYRETEFITSNLYYMPMAIIYMIGNDIASAYQVHMFFVQMGTFFGAWLFFKKIVVGKNSKMITLMGTSLYMLSPFRLYVCYDIADITQAVVWMLVPCWGYTIIKLYERNNQKGIYGQLPYIVLNALLFAATGYINSAFVLPLFVISLVVASAWRNVWILLADGLGVVIAMPVLIRMFMYITRGDIRIEYSTFSLIEEGYYLGDIFNSFSYRTAHPGLGLGMILCLAIYIWLIYVERQKETVKKDLPLIAAAVIFLILSMKILPWDMLKSMDNFIGRISLYFYTPEIFMGMFYASLCTLVVRGKYESEDKTINDNICFWLGAVIAICFMVGSYLCGNILYDRAPLTKV